VDFGISKVLKASTTKLTHAQMVVGTPEYMAPEQAAGKVDEIDHRSDQWSLACIVWRMVVGQQPFIGPDVNTILHQVMNGEPPPLGPKLARFLPGEARRCCGARSRSASRIASPRSAPSRARSRPRPRPRSRFGRARPRRRGRT